MTSIKELPEFASLCSFIQLFGEELNVTLSHNQLAKFLEVKDAENVPKIWIDIHRRLLSRIKYHCSIDKWEGTLKKCLLNVLGYDSDLANFNGTNYFGISADNRAKILNILFDCQFDKNIKFKEKVNLKFISDLRTQPFGSDIHGCIYWLFVDSDVNIIMYKENLEEESFKIVAESVETLQKLQEELIDMDYENAVLSKLYLENSPSDEIDNSRNQSPFIDNGSNTCEKSTIKIDPVKLENLENIPDVPKEEELTNHSDNSPDNVKSCLLSISKTENDVELAKPIKTEESNMNDNKVESVTSQQNDEEQIQEDCKTPEKKKKGRKPNNSPSTNLDDSLVNSGLRRSERKRKPVNLFSISYSESFKKFKSSSQSKSEKETVNKDKSEKSHKKLKEKRKKGRPRKKTESSNKKGKKETKKSKGKHKNGRSHKKHKSKHPWEDVDSSEDHVELDDDYDAYINGESDCSLSIKEMWDDKPESDFDVDKMSISSDEETSKARGRNYFRQKSIKTKKQEVDDKPCQICLRNNIPEMILLCDDCDLGHHAMCLRPSLMIIPEGDWYCPKCQHKKLLSKLSEKISELEKSLLKNNAKIRMQERLNFVNISMTNILSKNQDRRRARKPSCESDNGSQTDCNSTSQSLSSSSGSYDSSDNSSDSDSKPHGRYKFRETSRKENTKYNFEEIDKMFDDALEHDEKYKLLKMEHETRDKKSENSQSLESEPEYDYSGIEPRKKSSGKDMANIINEDKPMAAGSLIKRKRLRYDSDFDDFEDDTKDIDFKISDQSDSEFDEYECIEGDATNCSDDDWIASKKKSSKKTSRKKDRKRAPYEHFGFQSRPKRNATRNVNYRNMLGDDEDEDSALNEQSPEYESSCEDDNKPPPVISRKKDKYVGRLKKRMISDSEYEEENSKSESIADSGSTEKLGTVKRKSKPDLNSDSENSSHIIKSKIPKIDDDNSKLESLKPIAPPIVNLETASSFPSLAAILNPMRAKGDEDDDVENEVESETECDLTISLSEDLNNQNLVPKV